MNLKENKVDSVIVIKITKHYRSGSKVIWKVVDSDEHEDLESLMEDVAVEWGEVDSSGSNYGYTLNWEREYDKNIILKKIIEEKERVSSEIIEKKKWVETLWVSCKLNVN